MIIGGLVAWFVGSAGLAYALGKTAERLQAQEKALLGLRLVCDNRTAAAPSS